MNATEIEVVGSGICISATAARPNKAVQSDLGHGSSNACRIFGRRGDMSGVVLGGTQAKNLVNGRGRRLGHVREHQSGGRRIVHSRSPWNGAREVLKDARLAPTPGGLARGTISKSVGSGWSLGLVLGQVARRNGSARDIVGTDSFQTGHGSLRGADGSEFGNEVDFSSPIQSLELSRAGMSHMVEIKGTGDSTLPLFICEDKNTSA